MNTTPKIKQIDARSIQDIELENKHLREKLNYNLDCLKFKRQECSKIKQTESLKRLLEKNRKTFAFRINLDPIQTTQYQEECFNILKNTVSKYNNAKIIKIFMLNNFIYFKTNLNITLNLDKIPTNDGHQMEQLNPKDILKLY